jgi:hypothetical protein
MLYPSNFLSKGAVNIGITAWSLASLFLAKLTTLSILENAQDTLAYTSAAQQYALSAMFVLIWATTQLVLVFLAVIVYAIVKKDGKTHWLKHVGNFVEGLASFFKPNAWMPVLFLVSLMGANVLLMFFYIETKNNDTIVFDKSDEAPDDEANVDDDKDGVGFVYRLVEMLCRLDATILLFGVWVVDYLSWCTR